MKTYTRIEKIRYFTDMLIRMHNGELFEKYSMEKVISILDYLTSKRYQDWSERVSIQTKMKKIAEKKYDCLVDVGE